MADEIDQALALLSDAVKRTPDQGIEIADGFLKAWEDRLNPKSEQDDNQMMFYFYREYLPAAPLTRGRQRRNLDRLAPAAGDAAGDRAWSRARSRRSRRRSRPATARRRSTPERTSRASSVPSRKCPPPPHGARHGHGREPQRGLAQPRGQRANGTKRTDTEIAQLVDKGYGLALELIEVSIAAEPDSWKDRGNQGRPLLRPDAVQAAAAEGRDQAERVPAGGVRRVRAGGPALRQGDRERAGTRGF
jgi:hypothetical protein